MFGVPLHRIVLATHTFGVVGVLATLEGTGVVLPAPVCGSGTNNDERVTILPPTLIVLGTPSPGAVRVVALGYVAISHLLAVCVGGTG